MYALQPIVSTGFVHPGHNRGATAPDADAQVFAREATIDTQIGATVAAKDKPHLTLNDKIYAARLALGSMGPALFSAPAPIDDDDDDDDDEQ